MSMNSPGAGTGSGSAPVDFDGLTLDQALEPDHSLSAITQSATQSAMRSDDRASSSSNGRLAGLIDDEKLPAIAQGLGWFSVGLGLAQVLAPGGVAKLIGVRDTDRTRTIMRLFGLREITSGLGILASERPTPWLWSRVGGDVLDLAMLGATMNSDDSETDRVVGATAAVLGIGALDYLVSDRFTRNDDLTTPSFDNETPEVRKYITVNRPVEEVYAFWRDFTNLPRFMHFLESVTSTGDGHSHWVAKAPFGRTIAWDAETTSDVPNQEIAWRSLPGADIENSGSVRFSPAPGDRGTEVRVEISYAMPGGKVVALLSHLFPENPEREVYDDLRAFKQVLETGEVVLSEALAGGSRVKQHPAQPPANPSP